MNFKQLFCKHTMKELSYEKLGTIKRREGLCFYITYPTYTRYAVTNKCVKCGKIKITEEEYLVI